jgi:ATP-binding cassette subfamily C protein CydD
MPAWRRQVTWVPQRPVLMSGTVAANIALGQAGAGRDAIASAAGLAGADGFIRALPDGYDTPLGERGLRLSAGQRQRIAIARAFLRDAPLLLLDEPVAHLDPVTAAQILDAVERLMAGRTVVLVSHGMRWRGGADRTLTLDGGRMVLAAGCLPGVTGVTG